MPLRLATFLTFAAGPTLATGFQFVEISTSRPRILAVLLALTLESNVAPKRDIPAA